MHGAVSIRSQDPYSSILQSFEDLRTGMSVRFVFSRGYDSDTRLHGSEEFRHRRILTSMMADFQHFRMQLFRAILRKNFAFHLFFCISRQENV